MVLNRYTKQLLQRVLLIAGILVALSFCYFGTFKWMIGRYMAEDSYYSHGFLVPFVSLYLIWLNRRQWQNKEIENSKVGLFIVIIAGFLHLLGTILYIFSISGFSFFVMIFGLALFLCGWKKTKAIIFPLFFLIFMIPLPMAIITSISFPLKLFAAKAGVSLVSIIGVPVYHEGFNIFIPAGHLLVGNPCSGLRSLIAFVALGTILAYISDCSVVRKLLLIIISIPVAILSNMIRIPILVLVSHKWGLSAAAPETIVHTSSGLIVFIIGFLLLLMFIKVLSCRA